MWSVALVTAAFGLLALLFAEVQRPDPLYQATAVVKFERTTTLVGLLVETISLSQGDTPATQAAVIRSFPVLERAAKALRLIPATLDSEAIKQDPVHVQLLGDLRNQVTATPEENTTLINVTVASREPAQAARIANAVAQAYQAENAALRNRKILEARRFIEEQIREVSARVRQAEDSIRTLKETRGFVSLTEETTASVARLGVAGRRVREDPTRAGRGRRPDPDPAEAARRQGAVPARVLAEAGDPGIAKLSGALVDLSLERENLLVTLTPQHPQIRDLDARIASIRESLDARVRAAREDLLRELRVKNQILEERAGRRAAADPARPAGTARPAGSDPTVRPAPARAHPERESPLDAAVEAARSADQGARAGGGGEPGPAGHGPERVP